MDKITKKKDCNKEIIRRESKIMGFSNKIFKARVSST